MTAFMLKLIALILMTCDHVQEYIPGIPIWLRWLGRGAAVLFFFCCAESAVHTHDRRAYCKRLYLMSVGMAWMDWLLPLSLSFSAPHTAPYPPIPQNIFSSLFPAAVLICILEETKLNREKRRKWLRYYLLWQLAGAVIVLACNFTDINLMPVTALCGSFCGSEGPVPLTLLILLFYLCRESKCRLAAAYSVYCLLYGAFTVLEIPQRVHSFLVIRAGGFAELLCLPLSMLGFETVFRAASLPDSLLHVNFQWMMIFALPLLLAYNGKRGRPQKKLFYIYYPAHILVLYLLSQLVLT